MATILVVDDDKDIQRLIVQTVELAGHETATAFDGEEALHALERQPFDLVILDIMMPRMNGYEVLEKMRAMPSRAHTPVVVVTAKHDPQGVLREIEGGIVDHIAKPFLPSELEAVIERVLSGSDAAAYERRRALATQAEIYGSMDELFQASQEEDQEREPEQ